MIEKKLIVGKFMNFIDPHVVTPPHEDGDFITQPVKALTWDGTTFQWLAWVPGAINQVFLHGLDVLTGPMSGCWVVIYRVNGIEYVGHIGTDYDSLERTRAVKRAWNACAVNTARTSMIAGFNPLKAWAGDLPQALRNSNDSVGQMYGLVTASHELYAVFLYSQKDDSKKRRIAGVQRINTATPTDLRDIFGLYAAKVSA